MDLKRIKIEKINKIIFTIVLTLFVIVVRKDTFYNFLINYDEAEWLYCLKRLTINYQPFSGFDAHTSGPFAIYLISPILLICKNFTIVDLRIYGLIILLIPIIIMFKKKQNEFIIYSSIYTSFLLIFEKDFYAYNTEWLIIPILFGLYSLFEILMKGKDNKKLILYGLLILTLPLIKFQTIIFSCFYFILTIYMLIIQNRKKELLLFINIMILIVLIISTFFIYTNNFKLLIDNYIFRNVYHTKLINTKSVRDVFYVFRETIVKLFKYHILIIFSLSIFFIYKKGFYDFINKFKLDILLICITLITIFIPRTNWHHYFQLLFFALTVVISKLIILNSFSRRINLVYILIVSLYSIIIFDSLTNDKIKDYKIEIPEVHEITKNVPYNSKLIVLGWFDALPIYYKLLHKYIFVNPTSHTFYISLFRNNSKLYSKQINPMINLLNKNTDYLIDPEDIVNSLNDKNLNKIINKKFNIISNYRKGLIYKKK